MILIFSKNIIVGAKFSSADFVFVDNRKPETSELTEACLLFTTQVVIILSRTDSLCLDCLGNQKGVSRGRRYTRQVSELIPPTSVRSALETLCLISAEGPKSVSGFTLNSGVMSCLGHFLVHRIISSDVMYVTY